MKENKITNEYLESLNSTIRIESIRLILQCQKCNRKFSIYFKNVEELLNPPSDFHNCLSCNPINGKSVDNDGYVTVTKNRGGNNGYNA